MKYTRRFIIAVLLAGGFLTASFGIVLAQSVNQEIQKLNDSIDTKQVNIDQIRRKMNSFQEKIDKKQAERATLAGEMDLLGNRIAKTELDIKATGEEIDSVSSEILILDKEIFSLEEKLAIDRESITQILREIQVKDGSLTLELLFGSKTFSELFDEMQALEKVNSELSDTLSRTSSSKQLVLNNRTEQEAKRNRLDDLHEALLRSKELLGEEAYAKETLVTETQQDEAQFRSLLYELNQEQAYINSQIAQLQGDIEGKLIQSDGGGAPVSGLSWPVDSQYQRISATFHDPTYPFRHLFEHSGIDIPAPVGSNLHAAAPGYVAWTRTGRMYGNYVMVIHAGGIATLYAHLSSINVDPDQFVARGDIIGHTGNTGFSTGPHLHFEVRKDGIPVDPLGYIVDR